MDSKLEKTKIQRFIDAFGDSMNMGFSKFRNTIWYTVLAIFTISLGAILILGFRGNQIVVLFGENGLSDVEKRELLANDVWGVIFLIVFGVMSCAVFGKVFVDLLMGIVAGFRALKGETSTENEVPTTNSDNTEATSSLNDSNGVPSEPTDTKEEDTPTTESNTNPLTIDDSNKETPSSLESVETPPSSEPIKVSSVSPPTFASHQPVEPNKKLSVRISSSFIECFLDCFTDKDENEPNKKSMYDMLTNKLCSRDWLQMDLERVGLLLYYIDVIDFEKLENKCYNKWIPRFYTELGLEGLPIIGESKTKTFYRSKEVSFDKTFDFLFNKYLELYPEGKGPIRFTKQNKQTPPKTQ